MKRDEYKHVRIEVPPICFVIGRKDHPLRLDVCNTATKARSDWSPIDGFKNVAVLGGVDEDVRAELVKHVLSAWQEATSKFSEEQNESSPFSKFGYGRGDD